MTKTETQYKIMSIQAFTTEKSHEKNGIDYIMSLVADRFEYWIIIWFFPLPAENNNKYSKFKVQSSTRPNRWATKDINWYDLDSRTKGVKTKTT